ncbi:hypothetical protein PPERSA_04508 [Pseudocohnilembus persalinus]|uniref:Uncharacterized protein n=1 Tax=Pseudocohnilembus persalinus TaxID=266149 RepID=A0A0V0QT22_PSEPJ|nr:hypothetical protein PPERSA_04508 [Pseudocohnilembus persalinus]|eukprot:KRX05471.1 hypothetical protein PPERSA_04508 [Pseudocohnilembus persalinus]
MLQFLINLNSIQFVQIPILKRKNLKNLEKYNQKKKEQKQFFNEFEPVNFTDFLMKNLENQTSVTITGQGIGSAFSQILAIYILQLKIQKKNQLTKIKTEIETTTKNLQEIQKKVDEYSENSDSSQSSQEKEEEIFN